MRFLDPVSVITTSMQRAFCLYVLAMAAFSVNVWICDANDASELSQFLLRRQLQNEILMSTDSGPLGGQQRNLLSSFQGPTYGQQSRRLIADDFNPTYGGSNAERRKMGALADLPSFVYGNGHRRSVVAGLYGGSLALDHGRRMIGSGIYGSVESRELLNRALSAVLNTQKAASDAGTSIQLSLIEDLVPNTHSGSQTNKKVSAKDKASKMADSSLPGILPVGQCYCRFDYDWSEWSLSDATCKASLYHRASDPRSGLAKVWLDDYYSYKPTEGGVLLPPNADQISAFLYSDCTPAPPCSCLDIGEGSSSEACFNEIQIYAAHPDRYVPDAVLQDAVADGSEHTTEIRTWIQDAFPQDMCAHYQGEPYVYAPLIRPALHAWIEALKRIVGVSYGPTSSPPMILSQLLLASTCVLVLLVSILKAKKLVAPAQGISTELLDQP
ncbi:hypothetical protein CEUSTIGMA_g3759.t1 [Chlamydomonas eustigma]|uniref:Uncharacterized protein n=1 Tax=Chlamydomonas eustigma TaxID=1157962 RepID=A0A250WZP2_9CHLO|nr:hypothetical protein CEUSTIGMA_g3759.t1 [Chlamydomonas eustigma]|eukprot:GAX76313.1 hypothetical protein CEUSTIGMA_g3759.t1 [Chlamydomonas eustigma]